MTICDGGRGSFRRRRHHPQAPGIPKNTRGILMHAGGILMHAGGILTDSGVVNDIRIYSRDIFLMETVKKKNERQ